MRWIPQFVVMRGTSFDSDLEGDAEGIWITVFWLGFVLDVGVGRVTP